MKQTIIPYETFCFEYKCSGISCSLKQTNSFCEHENVMIWKLFKNEKILFKSEKILF